MHIALCTYVMSLASLGTGLVPTYIWAFPQSSVIRVRVATLDGHVYV
jgi:hypothetical protein